MVLPLYIHRILAQRLLRVGMDDSNHLMVVQRSGSHFTPYAAGGTSRAVTDVNLSLYRIRCMLQVCLVLTEELKDALKGLALQGIYSAAYRHIME